MNDAVLRVRYAFKGFDMPLNRLGVPPVADDSWIKQALARYLVVPLSWLNSYDVQRDTQGNVTLLAGDE